MRKRGSNTVLAASMTLALGVGCVSSDSHEAAHSGSPQHHAGRQELKEPRNTDSLPARHLVAKLADAGLEAKDLGPAQISLDDSSRFPEEPRSTVVLRVSDGKGNASPMTFVEFGSWKAAAKLANKPINGFAVRNWFVLGTTSTYFVDLVTEALES